MIRFFFTFLLFVFLFSCSKSTDNRVLLYANDFETAADLSEFTINTGEINITDEDSANDSEACLNIFGWCGTPNLSLDIGPFEENYRIELEGWIKTDYGAAIHLSIQDGAIPSNYLRLETGDILSGREWTHYTDGPFDLMQGVSARLYIDASNNTLSHTWIDDIRIYGTAF